MGKPTPMGGSGEVLSEPVRIDVEHVVSSILGWCDGGAAGDLGDDTLVGQRGRVTERATFGDVLSSRRMILPLRVFGRSGVKWIAFGFAIGPIFAATCERSISACSGVGSMPPFRMTYAMTA